MIMEKKIDDDDVDPAFANKVVKSVLKSKHTALSRVLHELKRLDIEGDLLKIGNEIVRPPHD